MPRDEKQIRAVEGSGEREGKEALRESNEICVVYWRVEGETTELLFEQEYLYEFSTKPGVQLFDVLKDFHLSFARGSGEGGPAACCEKEVEDKGTNNKSKTVHRCINGASGVA